MFPVPSVFQSYDTHDLASILKTLKAVKARWKILGLHLGINVGELAAIQKDYRLCEDCLYEVIHVWLSSDGERTSIRLSQALLAIGERELAAKILEDAKDHLSDCEVRDYHWESSTFSQPATPQEMIAEIQLPVGDLMASRNLTQTDGQRNESDASVSTPAAVKVKLRRTHQKDDHLRSNQVTSLVRQSLHNVKKKSRRINRRMRYIIILIIVMVFSIALFGTKLYDKTNTKKLIELSENEKVNVKTDFEAVKKPLEFLGNITVDVKTDEHAVPVTTSQTKTGHLLSLPVIKEHFVGRKREMESIIELLNDASIDIVNVYAPPGFGKYTIIKHVGHAMEKHGFNVYFISLENVQRSGFENQVSLITDGRPVRQWASDLNKNTLIIIDKVDNYWYEHIYELKEIFINPVIEYSKRIKVLMTSMNRVYAIERSAAYPLPHLNMDDCISLFQIVMKTISSTDAERICILVGGIPLVIKVIASIMVPPSVITVDYVIDSLESSQGNIDFIADHNEMVIGKDVIIGALDLAFKSLSKECKLSSLFLLRSGDYFSLEKVQHVLSKEMRKYMAGTIFHVEKCLQQMARASLIEIRKSFSRKNVYFFHTLIKNYLANQKVNNTLLLESFWKNYFHLPFWYRKLDLILMDPPRILPEDIVLYNYILQRTDDYFVLNHMLDNSTLWCKGCPYIELISRMINDKLNCSIPSHIRGNMMLHVWFIGRLHSRTVCSFRVNHNYTAEPLKAVQSEESFIRRCDYHCVAIDSMKYNCLIKRCGSQEWRQM